MNKLIAVFIVFATVCAAALAETQQPDTTDVEASFDDIVVESALNIRKPARQPVPDGFRIRRAVEIPIFLVAPQGRLYRDKRQLGGFNRNRRQFGGFGQSSALANSASQGQYFGPNGFGGAAANAQGQAFQAQGPGGGFGASAAGTQTQAFNVGPQGFQGSAGLSGSQAYNLPGGQTVDVAYGGTYAVGPNGRPTYSNSNSVGFSG